MMFVHVAAACAALRALVAVSCIAQLCDCTYSTAGVLVIKSYKKKSIYTTAE
jgi:hypothetical protein